MSVLNEFLGTIPAEQNALVRALDAVISKAAPTLAASLNDPRGLLTGTGKDMRHIKVVSQADADLKYVAELVKQAARLGGEKS
jgi:hypothetical protein